MTSTLIIFTFAIIFAPIVSKRNFRVKNGITPKEIKTEFPFICAVVTPTQHGTCTYIGQGLVLTAKHVVTEEDGIIHPATRLVFGAKNANDAMTLVQQKSPFSMKILAGHSIKALDDHWIGIAVLQINRTQLPSWVKCIPIGQKPQIGSPVILIGYGIFKSSKVLRYGHTLVQVCTKNAFLHKICTNRSATKYEVSMGDSGGPLLSADKGGYTMVAGPAESFVTVRKDHMEIYHDINDPIVLNHLATGLHLTSFDDLRLRTQQNKLCPAQ